MRTKSIFYLVVLLFCLSGCFSHHQKKRLIIFHAGSLSVPFKQIAKAFEKKYPCIKVELEAAGSRTCARKISDLNKPCDIMASADYKVINNLLIPEYASWNIKFASNEMVLVYSNKSKKHKYINNTNWLNILLDAEVSYGRSDPNSDPCGYRTVLTAKLAECIYNRPGIADSLLNKNIEYMRPKEVDLLALLEAQVIDYLFIYRSVAKQHNLSYLILPDSINLKNTAMSDFYKTATVDISGKKPGTTITHNGETMIYGITQLTNAPNLEYANKFLEFFFIDSIGIKIMEQNGQPSVIPMPSESYNNIPDFIKRFALPF